MFKPVRLYNLDSAHIVALWLLLEAVGWEYEIRVAQFIHSGTIRARRPLDSINNAWVDCHSEIVGDGGKIAALGQHIWYILLNQHPYIVYADLIRRRRQKSYLIRNFGAIHIRKLKKLRDERKKPNFVCTTVLAEVAVDVRLLKRHWLGN